jgi:hypothetical protein
MSKKHFQKGIDFDTVREIGLSLPGVEEGTAFGAPALKVNGKMMVCVPTHRSAEPGSLLVRMSLEDRDALLSEAPDAFYVKEHYLGYPCVLVRLLRVDRNVLSGLLGMAHKFVGATKRLPRKSATKKYGPT